MKKPFKTYNGGKSGAGVYQNIINNIPKCEIYLEPMVGNGGIVYNLNLPGTTVINDVDGSVMDAHFKTMSQHSYSHVMFFQEDYKVVLNRFDGVPNAFFYFDPPYHFDTRKSKRNIYKYEWSHEQHVDFLQRAVNIKSNCMISHYSCELYDTMLKGWRTFDFACMTRNGQRTERIYMNYPEPEILQDYSYTGSDYKERQRIKRKVSRHLKRLEAMPLDERNVIISSIIDKYGATAESLITNRNN